jgi:sigma-B regulation protein RsbU (phosphoserine phosphatase)
LVEVARSLDASLAGSLGPEDFVTVVLAEFGPQEVRLVNCGHHPPLLLGGEPVFLAPESPSPPLGLFPVPVLQRVPLRPHDRMLFYTDGLAEARSVEGRMFPLGEQARRCLGAATLEDAVASLLDAVLEHTRGELDDDLALLLGEAPAERAQGDEPLPDPSAAMAPGSAGDPPPEPEPVSRSECPLSTAGSASRPRRRAARRGAS